MSEIIYLSHFLNESTPGYGGSVGFERTHVSEISKGATSNSQRWIFSNHVGTHIDLSAHFDDHGPRLDDFTPSDWVMKKPFLLNLPTEENHIIEPGTEFDSIPKDCDFLILKTGFEKKRSESTYWSNGPGLSPELAKWIRKNRPAITMMGFDFISITSFPNRPLGRIAHQEFLGTKGEGRPLRVIEDMKLGLLLKSPLKVIVAPVLVSGADGAPVTVIAEM